MADMNEQLVLISGESSSGKSAALRNIKNQDRWMYLNCEAGKRLPFKNSFKTFKVTDPWQVYEGFDHVATNPDKWDGIAVDTVTFLMNMYESQYVINAADTQKAWGSYAQFFMNLMQDKVASLGKPVIILGHTRHELNEKTHRMEASVPIKGSLKGNGVEAYFSTVVSTKKVEIRDLEKSGANTLLKISDEEKELGYKHVFQTRPTAATVGERIRSPMGLFTKEQTYIDNDAQMLLEHLRAFYA